MKKIKVISGISSILIMALIFFFSSQTAGDSSRVSGGIVAVMMEFIKALFPASIEDNVQYLIHVLIRKMAHLSLFFLLGISYYYNVKSVWEIDGIKGGIIALCLGGLYAITDEVHQIFVPGRAYMMTDVLIDGIGTAMGVGLIIVIEKLREGRKSCGN